MYLQVWGVVLGVVESQGVTLRVWNPVNAWLEKLGSVVANEEEGFQQASRV